MTYNSFYEAGIDWIGDCMLENIQAVKFPVYAGLYMPDMENTADFRRAIDLVHRKGGAGISLFGGVSDDPESVGCTIEVSSRIRDILHQ